MSTTSPDFRLPSIPVFVKDWPRDFPFSPEQIGLCESDGKLMWHTTPDLLDLNKLLATFRSLSMQVFDIIDSTSTQLVDSANQTSIADHLCLAEFQYGGRGRRGRSWLSPYARNLAVSLGVDTQRTLPELGGLSLVVGMALADVFESLEIQNVQLKWPNDVLVSGHKLSGILVELVQRGQQVEYVVGIGVNVLITNKERKQIEQPVADLRQHGVTASRTDLVIMVIRKVQEYLGLFEREGFRPFVTAFNDLHLYHGETCALVQGKHSVVGEVQGIGEQGELLLRTPEGVQSFHGGEVSLRPQ